MAYSESDTDIARVCHEAARALQYIQGDPSPAPPWDAATEWMKSSTTEGVRLMREGVTPREHHLAWVRRHVLDGWVQGPVKDPVAKTHPCLVPYDQLPASQRLKNQVFMAIVNAMTQ